MAFPPFPSQELAKLVLGYLAEEQLMTAYDEFLQASPYVDALRNEYDRIFMTSLRNILAEYRALKIFVETCKPYILRRKLFQCGNLLEIIKYLVQNVDIKKISNESHSTVKTTNSIACQSCNTSQANCICEQTQSRRYDAPVPCSVEATPLTDLPGSHVKKFPNVQELSQQPSASSMVVNQPLINHIIITDKKDLSSSQDTNNHFEISYRHSSTIPSVIGPHNTQPACITTACTTGNIATPAIINKNVSNLPYASQNRSSGSFQEFVKGVTSGDSKIVDIASNSRASDNMGGPGFNAGNIISRSNSDSKTMPFVSVGKSKSEVIDLEEYTNTAVPVIGKENNKVKIISDIKMDLSNKIKIPANTSTPLVQTIYINGTPAYRTRPLMEGKVNFTKDEIMAMPTLILITTSGPPHIPIPPATTVMAKLSNVVTTRSNVGVPLPSLSPLTIDITSSNPPTPEKVATDKIEFLSEDTLVKTADLSKFVSLPKDISTNSSKTNTPHVLPALRKASSTPRRISHVRVLDFATPRRILLEGTEEEGNKNIVDTNDDTNSSKTQNSAILDTETSEVTVINVTHLETTNNTEIQCHSLKDSQSTCIVKGKKSSWDQDLRAVAIADTTKVSKPKPKVRKKTSKKKQPEIKQNDEISNKETKSVKTETKKSKNSKQNQTKTNEISEDKAIDQPAIDCVVKPTINIVPNTSRCSANIFPIPAPEKQKTENKPTNDQLETPDIEDRVALQNAIGVKLNISDLLETPYKQALYDIQMETPRYLGPDLPGEPLSDIKIMSIPTPRFLTTPNVGSTPKPPQATPSSYCSRPTDYSSGSSYYRPDDQDYVPAPELLACTTVTTNVAATSNKDEAENLNKNAKNAKNRSSRPVRQCTKNVSYFKNAKVGEKIDTDSSGNEDLDSTLNKIESQSISEPSKTGNEKRQTTRRRRKSTKQDSPKLKIKPKRSPFKKLTPKNKKVDTPKSTVRKKTNSNNTITTVIPIPTKSRRKSSTPRKLPSKTTNIDEGSPKDVQTVDSNMAKQADNLSTRSNDSDTDQPLLRWQDDSSETKSLKDNLLNTSEAETDDISKIQEYIQTTNIRPEGENSSSLHIDLVKRGFDIETAKSIERDLLDVTNHVSIPTVNEAKDTSTKPVLEKSIESDTSACLHIVQDEEDDDSYDFSLHECNEESRNYLTFEHDVASENISSGPVKFRDNFLMEVCIDDGEPIKLCSTSFSLLIDQDPEENNEIDAKETANAISSISNIDKLYTPLKDTIRAQCHDIFDSTLTSLDTPIKPDSPMYLEQRTVTEIVLEVEPASDILEDVAVPQNTTDLQDSSDQITARKRKRESSDDSQTSKKTRPEAQYLLKSANIQNIDIESVLSKLHGP